MYSTSLVALKISTGTGLPGGLVSREALLPRLEGLGEARLVLVSAPPGFGKTSLLAEWLGLPSVSGAAVRLDERDNDPARFMALLHAAAAAGTDTGGTPTKDEAIESAGGATYDARLTAAAVVRALAASPRGRRKILVLDDYHVITDPAIHSLVAWMVERLPPSAALAIATRSDPPLPLARWRSSGLMLEIRTADLRLDVREADALLRSSGVELAGDQVRELAARTEGWAAALRLAAVSLRDQPDQADRVHRFGATHRFVLDYVLDEVLRGLSPDVTRFLLATSLLDRLTGDLCDAVTQTTGGAERLADLERANLLLIPLDDERRWYRYHALFAEVLRARLSIVSPGAVTGLHRRAADWWEAAGDPDQAILHHVAAGELAAAAGLVVAAAPALLSAGDLGTVRRWLALLPADSTRDVPEFSLLAAWCHSLAGEADDIESLLLAAEATATALGLDDARGLGIHAQAAAIRCRAADLVGDGDEAVRQGQLALRLVGGLPSPALEAGRGIVTALLANALRRAGDLDAAAAMYEASLPDLRASRNPFGAGRVVADLAWIAIARGRPREAAARCEAELGARWPTESMYGNRGGEAAAPAPAFPDGALLAALARARLLLRDVDGAEAAARTALDIAGRAGDPLVTASAHQTLSLARSDPSAGRRPTVGAAAPVDALTVREREVLDLVALGMSNRQIAQLLFISLGTVKSHIHAISGKLGAANRTEAVSLARASGLLGPIAAGGLPPASARTPPSSATRSVPSLSRSPSSIRGGRPT
jgi:LuxR family maltose regulon positive regulatory protein